MTLEFCTDITLITLINVFLVGISGGVLLWISAEYHSKLRRGRRVVRIAIWFFGVGLFLYFLGYMPGPGLLGPDLPLVDKIIDFLTFFILIYGLVSAFSLAVISAILFFVVVPSRVRKAIAILVVLLVAITALSVFNGLLGWAWNFPDIFGLVSGLLALSFTLYDRYLSTKQITQSGDN